MKKLFEFRDILLKIRHEFKILQMRWMNFLSLCDITLAITHACMHLRVYLCTIYGCYLSL